MKLPIDETQWDALVKKHLANELGTLLPEEGILGVVDPVRRVYIISQSYDSSSPGAESRICEAIGQLEQTMQSQYGFSVVQKSIALGHMEVVFAKAG